MHLCTAAEGYDVQEGECPEEELPGQPPVDGRLVAALEHPGDPPVARPCLVPRRARRTIGLVGHRAVPVPDRGVTIPYPSLAYLTIP